MLKKFLCVYTVAAAFSLVANIQAEDNQTQVTDSSIETLLLYDDEEQPKEPSNLLSCDEDRKAVEEEALAAGCPCCRQPKPKRKASVERALAECSRCRGGKKIVRQPAERALAECTRCRNGGKKIVRQPAERALAECTRCRNGGKKIVRQPVAAYQEVELTQLLACKDCK